MIETFEKVIGTSNYMITQLPARRALRLQAKLLKLIGPAFSHLFVNASSDAENADKALPKAISLFLAELDDKTFDVFVMEMLQGVRKDGHELTNSTVDSEFSGNLNELFLVIQNVLEVNFGDFLAEGGILKSLMNQDNQVISQKK